LSAGNKPKPIAAAELIMKVRAHEFNEFNAILDTGAPPAGRQNVT
jgi:hypothetical protein